MSSKALSIELGAKAAEVANAKKQVEVLKAKLQGIKDNIKDLDAKLKKSFAKFGVSLPDDFTKEDLDLAFAYVEAYNVKTEQLANQQVASLGFTPESERKRAAK